MEVDPRTASSWLNCSAHRRDGESFGRRVRRARGRLRDGVCVSGPGRCGSRCEATQRGAGPAEHPRLRSLAHGAQRRRRCLEKKNTAAAPRGLRAPARARHMRARARGVIERQLHASVCMRALLMELSRGMGEQRSRGARPSWPGPPRRSWGGRGPRSLRAIKGARKSPRSPTRCTLTSKFPGAPKRLRTPSGRRSSPATSEVSETGRYGYMHRHACVKV